jgi:hypothetical protein
MKAEMHKMKNVAIILIIILGLSLFGVFLPKTQAAISTQTYSFVSKWGSAGSGPGQFNSPNGLAVDNAGYVYVADYYNNRVEKFTAAGDFILEWGTYGTGAGQFSYPVAVTVDSSGYVYVADTYNNRIQKFTSEGVFLVQWGTEGSGPGQFSLPIGISAEGSDYIYVTDQFNYRVEKFTTAGVFVLQWGGYGSGPGQFVSTGGVAVDNSGHVYVTDDWSQRVEKFTTAGVFTLQWGSSGSGDGQFIHPGRVAVDTDGNVYTTDYGNNYVQKFTSNGDFLTKWGGLGSDDGQFNGASGIAVDTSGAVYVSEAANNRVQKFSCPLNTEWDIMLNASVGIYIDHSQLGARNSATSGFDSAFDTVNAPTPPGGIDSYIWCPNNPTSPVDLRKLETSMIPPSDNMVWNYLIATIGISGSLTISWSSAAISAIPQQFIVLLTDSQGNTVANMRNSNSHIFASQENQIYSFNVKVLLLSELTLNLNTGWNMVSFTVLPTDTLFADAFSGKGYYQVLTWTGTSYTQPSNIEAGRGYWILVLSPTTLSLTGIPVTSYTFDLPAGWSMIGSINGVVNCGSVFSGYYQMLTWSGTSYTTATTIEPGKGYWALVLTPTHITVG